MKKNISLKIVLMLIIITSILCIKTEKVNAAYSRWTSGSSWTGNASDVASNPQIFCRDYGGPLPYSGNTYTYKKEAGTSTTKYSYNDTNERPYAFIFNFIDSGSYSTISASPVQRAFWATQLGQANGVAAGDTNWRSLYGYTNFNNYLTKLAAIRRSGYEPTIVDSKLYDAANRKYGPITVIYPQWTSYNNKKFGLSFSVENNGVPLDPQPTITYNNNEVYITFSEAQINSGISRVNLKIKYNYLSNCWVEITKIKAESSSSSDPVVFWCDTHRNWEYKNISNFAGDPDATILYSIPQSDYYYRNSGIVLDSDVVTVEFQDDKRYYIYQYNNTYYLFYAHPGCDSDDMGHEYCNTMVTPQELQKLVHVYPYYESKGGSKNIDIQLMPTINVNLAKYNSIFNIKIDGNGNGNFLDAPTPLTNAQFKVEAYQRGTDGKLEKLTVTNPDGNGVRRIVPAGKDYTPEMANDEKVYAIFTEIKSPKGYKLLNCPIIAEYSLHYDSNKKKFSWWVMYQVPLENWTYSGFIDEKIYDTIFNEWLDKIELDEAVKTSLSNDYNSNIKNKSNYGKENLIYNHIKDIVNEDTAKNWKNYLKDRKTKIDNYVPWKFISEDDDNGDTFPNRYRSPKDDYLYIERISSGGEAQYIINVFDHPVIEKLNLVKVDADNGNTPLNGAKFTATFTNVKEFKYKGNIISGENPYTFTVDGSITITDVEYIDENEPIVITLEEIQVPNEGNGFYYKKLEGKITITIKHTPKNGLTDGTVTYEGTTETINNSNLAINGYEATLTIPNLRLIDLGGLVWLDGNKGIKPVEPPDGKLNDQGRVAGVVVTLDAENNEFEKQFNNDTAQYIINNNKYIVKAKTNVKGEYKFIGLRWKQNYNIIFSYDGINYENITYDEKVRQEDRDSKAQETDRGEFNGRFTTIIYNKSNDGTVQEYNYIQNDKESKLITLVDANLLEYKKDGTTKTNNNTYTILENKNLPILKNNNLVFTNSEGTAFEKYTMKAYNGTSTRSKTDTEINFGLVKRGTNLALSTDVAEAKVTINNKETDYTYNKGNNTVEIGKTETFDKPKYDLVLWDSDYTYRARDYVSNEEFVDKQNTGDGTFKTGENLRAFVTYKVNLQNQSTKQAYINEIYYKYDSRYEFVPSMTADYNANNSGVTEYNVESNTNNVMTIRFNKLNLGKDNGTKTLYLVFEIKDVLELEGWVEDPVKKTMTLPDTFESSGEITSYSTDEGFIDINSRPGNYLKDAQVEDDSDKARGITLVRNLATSRKITGTVWDDLDKKGNKNENSPINNVIVQLIEIVNIDGLDYEYIWQETVSGKGIRKKVSLSLPVQLTSDTFEDKNDGTYTFEGFIPGDYIVRFIYGDGTTKDYGLKDEMVKYNGQDYKSTIDEHYSEPVYNTAGYSADKNVARDNEARRLETMAWATNVDAEKGLLLKLLDLQTDAQITDYVDTYLQSNNVEKSLFITVYNKELDPDITTVTTKNVEELQKITLANTWMCAQTSKINVSVDTTNIATSENITTERSSDRSKYITTISNVNFGLVQRPKTEIKIEKHLTQMVIRASNGQTILSAYLDENGKPAGQIDGLQAAPGIDWIYSVSPTDIHTLIDGAALEFSYNIIVKNIGESDTLSSTLTGEYEKVNGNYANFLITEANKIRWGYPQGSSIGHYLGSAYYLGGEDSKVKTEVTSIYDYVNNDLTLVEGQTKNLTNSGSLNHYVLNDTYTPSEIKINTVLQTAQTSGKMEPNPNKEYGEYIVTLGRNPLSSTGTLDFTNYIAEVMSYSNAAGRRASTSTPGNAQAVNKDILNEDSKIPDNLKLELDEAKVENVKIEPALGENKEINYTWIVAIVVGIAVVGIGAFITKKYIIK